MAGTGHQYNRILDITKGSTGSGGGFGLFSRIFATAGDGDYSWVNAHAGKQR